jgi:hypothetical protein
MDDDRDRWARLLTEAAEERSAQPLRICKLCVEMADVSGAGISMVTPTRNRGVVCATDDVAARVESFQLELGEGPCIDAASQQAPVMVPDVDDPDDVLVSRWPAFIGQAADAGVRAVFALPLRIGAISVGVLDLYRARPGVLTEPQLNFTLMAADAAALSLLYLDRDGQDAGDMLAGLREAEIHQATGMVSVQMGVPIEEAFLLLRARAFSLDRPLDAVARDVVERRLRFSEEVQ